MKRSIYVVMLLALVVSVAAAAPPSGTPDTGSSSPPAGRAASRAGFGGASETTITGLVTGKDGTPITDVTVKLYVGGLLMSEAPVEVDGTFEMTELIDYGSDVTIDLWFVPEDPDLVMENILLKESSAAVAHELYSDCIPRSRLDPITDVVVTLVDLDTRNERLGRRDCLD
ncbi:MAG: hypothetical protein GF405_08295 [Candidatus Eisenbacteria bacterium]|nr:hypothetical protein [Candidatus Eisenbacteria bacterium]